MRKFLCRGMILSVPDPQDEGKLHSLLKVLSEEASSWTILSMYMSTLEFEHRVLALISNFYPENSAGKERETAVVAEHRALLLWDPSRAKTL